MDETDRTLITNAKTEIVTAILAAGALQGLIASGTKVGLPGERTAVARAVAEILVELRKALPPPMR